MRGNIALIYWSGVIVAFILQPILAVKRDKVDFRLSHIPCLFISSLISWYILVVILLNFLDKKYPDSLKDYVLWKSKK